MSYRDRDRNWYDTAQICLNGHVISDSTFTSPERMKKFCDKCGEHSITACQHCNTSIRGFYHIIGALHTSKYSLPGFCPECGKPYPWTEAKLIAAQELADEQEHLTKEEKEILKKSLNDLVRDTPNTQVAANRFKRLVAKAGPAAAGMFRDLLVDVVSEAAKKILFPQ